MFAIHLTELHVVSFDKKGKVNTKTKLKKKIEKENKSFFTVFLLIISA